MLFGGFVIAQAIVAATRDAPDGRRLHSLHAYFLRPVVAATPITYEITPIREGRQFTSRQVEASQDGKPTARPVLLVHGRHRRLLYDLPGRSGAPPLDRRGPSGPGAVGRRFLGPTPARGHGTAQSTHRMWFRIPGRAARRRAPARRAARLRDRLDRYRRPAAAPRRRHPGHGEPRPRRLVPPAGRAPTSGSSTTCNPSSTWAAAGCCAASCATREGRVVVSVAQEMRLTPI